MQHLSRCRSWSGKRDSEFRDPTLGKVVPTKSEPFPRTKLILLHFRISGTISGRRMTYLIIREIFCKRQPQKVVFAFYLALEIGTVAPSATHTIRKTFNLSGLWCFRCYTLPQREDRFRRHPRSRNFTASIRRARGKPPPIHGYHPRRPSCRIPSLAFRQTIQNSGIGFQRRASSGAAPTSR